MMNTQLISSYGFVSRWASGAVLIIGLLALIGWVLDIPVLAGLFSQANMKANTALGLILCGTSLWLLNEKKSTRQIHLIAKTCALVTVLIAALTLGEYFSGGDFGIDQLLARDTTSSSGTSFPGRMSPITALNLLFVGSALLLIDNRWGSSLSEFLTIVVFIIAGAVVVGYIYGVSPLYQIGIYSSIALQTALALLLLGLGILCARPEHGITNILSRDDSAGVLARRLLPAAIGIPIALGWLFISGQRAGYYESAFGLAIFAISNVVIFAILIWRNSRVLVQMDEERGKAEKALSLSEQRAQALIENSWDAIALFGTDGTILYGSPSTPQILGYTLDEFIGRNAFEIIHAEDQAMVTERLTLSLQRPGEHISVRARVLHKNGEWRWMEGVFTNLIHEPSVGAIVNNYHDFTERKKAEEISEGNQERFRRIVEVAPSAIIAVDRDGKIDLVNAKAQELFGYQEEELLGYPVEMLVPDRFRNVHTKYRQSFLAQPTSRSMGAGRDLFGVHKNGHKIPIEIGLTPYESSQGSFTLALIVDISERKQTEEEIRKLNAALEQRVVERTAALSQANSLLQMMLDHMPDQIYFKDAQSRFIRNSRSQAKALGLSDPAEAVGKSDFDFFPHAQESFEKEQEIIQSGKPLLDQEEFVIWPDGSATWVSTTKVPLHDQNGQIIGTFGISRDITGRKHSELEVQKAKLELEAANKELEAFSYSVSHDLRAPLRSVDGFSQALLEDYGDILPDDGRNFLERIRNSTQRMAQLIDDLLNLSKVTRAPLKTVAVDLSKLAENIAAELKRQDADRHVEFTIAQNLSTNGDPRLLQIVLENLMSNAWKFTSKRNVGQIEVGSKVEDGETVYFIRDNGAGFDMTYVNKLFGAFQRLHAMTEFPGTGIGLATIQRIIHRHGGRVWAEGAVGEGATFFFTLPTLEPAKPEAMPQEKESLAGRVKEII